MDGFADIRDTLLRHLPRVTTGTLLTIGEDGVHVDAPGISIADLALMLSDLSGAPSFLPEGLPAADIRLLKLALTKNPDGDADLSFTIVWDNASLAVADTFPLRLAHAQVDFTMSGTWLSAVAQATLVLDQYELAVSFELPSQMLEFRIDPEQPPKGIADLLASRGLVDKTNQQKLTIKQLVVRGSLLFQRLMIYVELENLFTIGPVTLSEAWGEAVIAGSDDSSVAAGATIVVAVPNHGNITVSADGEADQQGWRLAGSLEMADPAAYTIGILVDAVAASLHQSPPPLPRAIKDVGLKRLAIAVDTHDSSFTFDCTLDWKQAELVVHLEKNGERLLVTGSLALDEVVFKLAFQSAETTVLVASYDAAGSKPLTLDQILGAFTDSASLGGGASSVSLHIVSAALALDSNSNVLMAAEVDAGIDLGLLGNLPLVGSLLPKGEPLGLRIEPYFMADGFAAEAEARPLLPASLALPDKLTKGVHLTASLRLGGKPIVLDGSGPAEPAIGDDPAKAAPPSVPARKVASATPAASGSDVTWTNVDKALGPLKVKRIGYAIDKTMVDLAIDASLEIAGLTVSVDGLGVQYTFDTRELSTRLRGLGLDLKREPLAIGGAFLNDNGDFAGTVVISGEKFTLNAMGAFKILDGTPSMFAYGVLDMPLGGPAFFYVEGLSAGFGLHRRILMPKIDQVRSFPLVASAGVPMLTDGAAGTSSNASPGDVLATLHEFVSPALGEYFLAVGIKFNTFRLLHGFGLLIVTVGRNLEIDLIGTATYASPPDLPDNVPALAHIELDLIARIAPDEGVISVEGRLNPNSYVYGPLCHLSGGFAFYAWTKGPHAGDFVLSLGGYHPEYDIPSHYPSVPRVEIKYQVTPNVYLKGDGYFAMTPAIMMAGGGLHAQVEIGSLRAWADFTADFWVRWEPFHYDARIHVDVGAQWKCFHTVAEADLHIWGPDFSGTAHIDWFVFSFDVEFGPQSPVIPLPISVAKFKQSFLGITGDTPAELQATANATLGVTLIRGVLGNADDVAVVSPADLVVATSSRVPATTAKLGATAVSFQDPAPPLGIMPAAVAALDTSDLSVTVEIATASAAGPASAAASGGRVYKDVSNEFVATPVLTGFPAALWGPNSNAPPVIVAVSGLELRPVHPPGPGGITPIAASQLQYTDTSLSKPIAFWAIPTPASRPASLPATDLGALGLDPAPLVFVPPPSARAAIALGIG